MHVEVLIGVTDLAALFGAFKRRTAFRSPCVRVNVGVVALFTRACRRHCEVSCRLPSFAKGMVASRPDRRPVYSAGFRRSRADWLTSFNEVLILFEVKYWADLACSSEHFARVIYVHAESVQPWAKASRPRASEVSAQASSYVLAVEP